jgi:hypothetical protein
MRFSRLVVPAFAIVGGIALFNPLPLAAQPTTAPRAQPTGQPGGPPDRGARPEGPATAEQAMKQMNRSMKRLERQVADATKKEENLKLVGEAQRGCIAAKGMVPKGPWSEETDAAKKGAALEPYRRHLIVVAHKLLDLETAIMDGKGEDAKKLMVEINKLKDDAHKEMGVKEEE